MTLKISDVRPGHRVEFTLHASISNRTTITGEVIQDTTGRYTPDTSAVNANHERIYPGLPEEVKLVTSSDFRNIRALVIKTNDDVLVTVLVPWIIEDTLIETQTGILQITVSGYNSATQSPEQIKTLLANLKLTVTSIEEK